MKSVYLVRHQKHGVISEFAFENPPTEAQLEHIREVMESHHGTVCKVFGEPIWTRVVTIPLLGATDAVPLEKAKTLGGAPGTIEVTLDHPVPRIKAKQTIGPEDVGRIPAELLKK